MTETVFDQSVVNKFGAVVHIQRSQGEGQADTNAPECLDHETALSDYKGNRFGPSTGDVG